ncbi:MAG: DUF1674 domain-containing protein [Pseudomonadota bacterium]
MSEPVVSDPKNDEQKEIPTTEDGIPLIVNGRKLNDVEIHALREAKARRDKIDAQGDTPEEIGGADREKDPTRYLDWEKNGRAIDFS